MAEEIANLFERLFAHGEVMVQHSTMVYNPEANELSVVGGGSVGPMEDVRVTVSGNEFDEIVDIVEADACEPGECCSVCQAPLAQGTDTSQQIAYLPCDHGFHVGCIKTWLTEYSCKCPTCRNDVRTNQ